MSTNPKYKWHNSETGEFVIEAEYDRYAETPLCPQCGKPTDYWEGMIDQDFMGNDIDGWNFVCYPCGIGTDLTEGSYN